jgi:cardiolipin-specific phospholipase
MQGQEGTPYAARAAAGAAAASNSFFPLGYREGFSQWVGCQGRNNAQHH